MTTITLNNKIERHYKNNGQHAEQVIRFTLTGEIIKADNKSHKLGGDVLDIQVKSQKATVCKGYDINAYLALDGANRFAYVTSDFATAYVMDKAEYIEFVNEFSCKTRESAKNGGGEKLQLLSESKRMLEWFGARAQSLSPVPAGRYSGHDSGQYDYVPGHTGILHKEAGSGAAKFVQYNEHFF